MKTFELISAWVSRQYLAQLATVSEEQVLAVKEGVSKTLTVTDTKDGLWQLDGDLGEIVRAKKILEYYIISAQSGAQGIMKDPQYVTVDTQTEQTSEEKLTIYQEYTNDGDLVEINGLKTNIDLDCDRAGGHNLDDKTAGYHSRTMVSVEIQTDIIPPTVDFPAGPFVAGDAPNLQSRARQRKGRGRPKGRPRKVLFSEAHEQPITEDQANSDDPESLANVTIKSENMDENDTIKSENVDELSEGTTVNAAEVMEGRRRTCRRTNYEVQEDKDGTTGSDWEES